MLNHVPDNSTVVGVPGKVVRTGETRVNHASELDHHRVPNLVEQEICQVLRRVYRLEEEMREMCAQAGIEIERPLPRRELEPADIPPLAQD